ncbi:molybdenum cofactor biosynthesis protein MoaE [bacterium]|nr:MAG: molybdenum cofactor biosynthesis protein MoaE [bacterium]TNF32343.1 MAG: molybdenum cofactor biosynthesis protein MoaE [Deltaproteobacteria bacterium]
MEEKNVKNSFKEGAITSSFIGESIAKHQSKTSIGAHQIFLGQVRADEIDGRVVVGIDYTAHVDMANKVFHNIREKAFNQFDLTCMHIYHSLGLVKTGEICLFVFVSSRHRKEATRAIEYIVEEIKSKVPVFGKELLDNAEHVWKVNN